MSTDLVLGALLAAAAVVFVALPFLRAHGPPEPSRPPDEALARAEERDRALSALKELEFDHRTGKVTDEDYRAQVGELRRRAAQALLPEQTPQEAQQQPFSAQPLPHSRSTR